MGFAQYVHGVHTPSAPLLTIVAEQVLAAVRRISRCSCWRMEGLQRRYDTLSSEIGQVAHVMQDLRRS